MTVIFIGKDFDGLQYGMTGEVIHDPEAWEYRERENCGVIVKFHGTKNEFEIPREMLYFGRYE